MTTLRVKVGKYGTQGLRYLTPDDDIVGCTISVDRCYWVVVSADPLSDGEYSCEVRKVET